MAYAIKRSNLSPESINTIRSMLCLQPDTPNSKYSRGVVHEPVLFYNIEGDIVNLPFLFSASLFRINPNMDISYPSSSLIFTGKLRENQISVESEAWSQLERYGTTTLGLYPGFGKTILSSCLAARAKLITCILVHREILTIQWKKTFNDNTNARVWIVGERDPPSICDVIICMDTRWHHITSELRRQIGFLVIDEAHAFCTPTHVGCLLGFHPKYIVACSGSLERDDNMHQMIYAICGDHGVFRESTKPFTVYKIITNTKPIRKLNRMGGVDYLHLVQSTLMDERRNNIILDIVSRNTQFKILILTSLKDHAMLLYNCLEQMQIPCDYLCGTKRGYNDSVVLVGTVSKIGTGFDPATSCPSYSGRPFDLLLLVSSIKKEAALVQNIGRVFRADFPTVMHFVDNDDIFKSHWYKSRKWYLKRGGIIQDKIIDISDQLHTSTTENITNTQHSWIKNKTKQSPTNSLSLKIIK